MKLKETFIEVVSGILPIAIIVILLQLTIVKFPKDVLINFIAGSIMLILGLFLFLLGVNVGPIQVGELIGSKIVSIGKLWFILLMGFILGFVVTIAEPDVQVLALQVDGVTNGAIPKTILLSAVAIGVGIFIAISLLRIIFNIPLIYILAGGYALVFALAAFVTPEFVPISFDSGGVTTGPMTVPFILALGVGISAVKQRKSTSDSFGSVALASLGPILAVLILGVIYK